MIVSKYESDNPILRADLLHRTEAFLYTIATHQYKNQLIQISNLSDS